METIGRMNLRDLDYLVAVADTGHFGLAADRCRVSQPTLSMQVKKLEAELGTALFERSPRGALTTAIGAAIVARARHVQEVRQMRELAARGAAGFVGMLRLGVIPTAGPYILPRILPVIQATYPRLEAHLREAMTARLLALLHANELDAAIVSEPIDEPGLDRADLLRERFMLTASPAQAAALAGPDRAAALAGAPVLMLEDGHCLKDQTVLVCRRLGLQPVLRVQASSVETLRQMVALDYGLAVLPELATRGRFAGPGSGAGAVVAEPLAGADCSRQLVLVWRRTFPRPEQLQTLARLIRQELATDG